MALTGDEKTELKKAVARTLVLWVCQTRKDLLEELVAGKPPFDSGTGKATAGNEWAKLPAAAAVKGLPTELVTFLKEDINRFADDESTHSFNNNPSLRRAAEDTHIFSALLWRQSTPNVPDIECMDAGTINAMFNAALDHIDTL